MVGIVERALGGVQTLLSDGEPLTQSAVTPEAKASLARMFPRSVEDFVNRPLLGNSGKLRVGFFAMSAASVIAAAKASDSVTHVVKPTLMPLLAASCDLFATKGSREVAKEKWLDTGLLTGGLAFGCLGDIILMGKDGRSADGDVRASNLNKGASAFAVNQIAYHALLWRQGARPRKKDVLLRAPVVVGSAGLAAMMAPKALPAAAGYGSALATTSVLAEDHSPEAALGGNLFVISDALILARLTLLNDSPKLSALVDGAVMATYVAAQLLLVDALVKGALGGRS